jgi:hypothetical protein
LLLILTSFSFRIFNMTLPSRVKPTRKRSGHPSSFNESQQACIDGYVGAFEEMLRLHDPNYDTTKKVIGDWKKNTVTAILAHKSFADMRDSEDEDHKKENMDKCAAVS